jgi:hypothetical protein
MSTAGVFGKGKRRRLSQSEKYDIYLSALTGQATQREAAEQYGVVRSTVVTACGSPSKAHWRICRVVGVGARPTRGERSTIVDLFEASAGIDRSHRKLAARGWYM